MPGRARLAHTYAHARTRTHTHARTRTHTHIRTHAHTHLDAHLDARAPVREHVREVWGQAVVWPSLDGEPDALGARLLRVVHLPCQPCVPRSCVSAFPAIVILCTCSSRICMPIVCSRQRTELLHQLSVRRSLQKRANLVPKHQ